jgi:hypothetical protein
VHIREICRYTDYKQFRSTVKLIFQGQDVTNKPSQPSQPGPSQQPPAAAPTTNPPNTGSSQPPQ